MRPPYTPDRRPKFRPQIDFLEGRDTPASLFTASGTIAGGAPLVEVTAPGGAVLARINPFESDFRGGVRAATGELDGNPNTVEVAVVPGAGGGPRVQVYAVDTTTGATTRVADFLAYESTFRDGLWVAVGRLDPAAATDQIALGTDVGGGPRVRVVGLSGGEPVQIAGPNGNFFAFEETFRGGVRVGAGDVDGNPSNGDELIVGAGPGGAPRARVFGTGGAVLQDFFAGDVGSTAGLNVGFDRGTGLLRTDLLADDFSQRNAALNAPILAQLRADALAAGVGGVGATGLSPFGVNTTGFGGLTGTGFGSSFGSGFNNTAFGGFNSTTGFGGFGNVGTGGFGNGLFNTGGFGSGLFNTGGFGTTGTSLFGPSTFLGGPGTTTTTSSLVGFI